MKKKNIAAFLSALLIFMASCSNANIDSQIVGAWESERLNNSTYIFRANGTFERTTAFNEYYEGTYTAVDGVLILDYGEGYKKQELSYVFNNDKSSSDYGDMKIGYDYFEKVK